jgi:hypothetical protein
MSNRLSKYLRIENLANHIVKYRAEQKSDTDGTPILVVPMSEVGQAASEWGFFDDDYPDIIAAVEDRIIINPDE